MVDFVGTNIHSGLPRQNVPDDQQCNKSAQLGVGSKFFASESPVKSNSGQQASASKSSESFTLSSIIAKIKQLISNFINGSGGENAKYLTSKQQVASHLLSLANAICACLTESTEVPTEDKIYELVSTADNIVKFTQDTMQDDPMSALEMYAAAKAIYSIVLNKNGNNELSSAEEPAAKDELTDKLKNVDQLCLDTAEIILVRNKAAFKIQRAYQRHRDVLDKGTKSRDGVQTVKQETGPISSGEKDEWYVLGYTHKPSVVTTSADKLNTCKQSGNYDIFNSKFEKDVTILILQDSENNALGALTKKRDGKIVFLPVQDGAQKVPTNKSARYNLQEWCKQSLVHYHSYVVDGALRSVKNHQEPNKATTGGFKHLVGIEGGTVKLGLNGNEDRIIFMSPIELNRQMRTSQQRDLLYKTFLPSYALPFNSGTANQYLVARSAGQSLCKVENLEIRDFKDVTAAMDALHAANLVHRDIKPENMGLKVKYNVKLVSSKHNQNTVIPNKGEILLDPESQEIRFLDQNNEPNRLFLKDLKFETIKNESPASLLKRFTEHLAAQAWSEKHELKHLQCKTISVFDLDFMTPLNTVDDQIKTIGTHGYLRMDLIDEYNDSFWGNSKYRNLILKILDQYAYIATIMGCTGTPKLSNYTHPKFSKEEIEVFLGRIDPLNKNRHRQKLQQLMMNPVEYLKVMDKNPLNLPTLTQLLYDQNGG